MSDVEISSAKAAKKFRKEYFEYRTGKCEVVIIDTDNHFEIYINHYDWRFHAFYVLFQKTKKESYIDMLVDRKAYDRMISDFDDMFKHLDKRQIETIVIEVTSFFSGMKEATLNAK